MMCFQFCGYSDTPLKDYTTWSYIILYVYLKITQLFLSFSSLCPYLMSFFKHNTVFIQVFLTLS